MKWSGAEDWQTLKDEAARLRAELADRDVDLAAIRYALEGMSGIYARQQEEIAEVRRQMQGLAKYLAFYQRASVVWKRAAKRMRESAISSSRLAQGYYQGILAHHGAGEAERLARRAVRSVNARKTP